MTSLPTLETERLLLRPPELDDFVRWCEMMSDEATTRYIGGVLPPALVWRSIMAMRGAWDLTGVSMFSVIDKASGAWIGRVGPWQPFEWPGTEVGWSMHPAAQGRGLAFEAAVACMDYAVDVLGWSDVIHTIEPGNVRSQRLAQRLGSQLMGPSKLPPPFQDAKVELWGQRAAQWRSFRAQLPQ